MALIMLRTGVDPAPGTVQSTIFCFGNTRANDQTLSIFNQGNATEGVTQSNGSATGHVGMPRVASSSSRCRARKPRSLLIAYGRERRVGLTI
jgi:hypothetical protein